MDFLWMSSILVCIYRNTQKVCCSEMRFDMNEVKVKFMLVVYVYVPINQESELHS
jgi:hypothetical protein